MYELTSSKGVWNETILYSFAGGDDGASPAASVVFDAAGNLYGTTRLGGPDNVGTVFKLARVNGEWKESVLYSFTGGNDGGSPQAALTIVGNALIGTTPEGGTNADGTVFGLQQVKGKWQQEVLYSFVGGSTDGAYPYSTLILDKAGNLYGTTESGGANQAGSVFELSESGTKWNEKILYFFTGNLDGGRSTQA